MHNKKAICSGFHEYQDKRLSPNVIVAISSYVYIQQLMTTLIYSLDYRHSVFIQSQIKVRHKNYINLLSILSNLETWEIHLYVVNTSLVGR